MDCQHEYQYQVYIQQWKEGLVDGSKGDRAYGQVSNHIRKYLARKYQACCGCGISSWREKPITLEIEHKNGNPEDHSEDNLEMLCPNCHSQTDTYRNKNAGNGRKKRY